MWMHNEHIANRLQSSAAIFEKEVHKAQTRLGPAQKSKRSCFTTARLRQMS